MENNEKKDAIKAKLSGLLDNPDNSLVEYVSEERKDQTILRITIRHKPANEKLLKSLDEQAKKIARLSEEKREQELRSDNLAKKLDERKKENDDLFKKLEASVKETRELKNVVDKLEQALEKAKNGSV